MHPPAFPPALIGLDADDTLWHNEPLFRMTHARFDALLQPWAAPATVAKHLAQVERRNLATYGYGAKGFTLSMMETALELSQGQAPGALLAEILAAGREMMLHPMETLPGVSEALERLSRIAPLVLVTKGDLFHQESKLAASGLGRFFSGVEIVSEKTADTYRRAFKRHGAAPEAALIPYPLVWAHEAADAPTAHPRFAQFDALGDLALWLETASR